MLIAPILSADDERNLLLPPGGWYEYHTNAYLTGGKPLVIKAALDLLPLFVRAGVVLVVRDRNPQPVGQESNRLLIYTGDGETILYEDDGISLAYRAGSYRWVFISVRQDSDRQRVVISRRVAGSYTPSMPTFWVTVHGISEMPTRVTVDRQHAPVWYFDNGALDLQVPDDFREITITRETTSGDRTLLRRPVLS